MATRDPQSKLTDQQRDRARPIRIGAVVLIFFVAVFAVFWLWFMEPMRREQAHLVELAKRVETERAEAKGRIAPAEVELGDVRLEPAGGDAATVASRAHSKPIAEVFSIGDQRQAHHPSMHERRWLHDPE
jgi:hypothetical protein